MRSSREVTNAIKRNLVADMRVSPRDYELDHIVPLDGAPLDLRNLMLRPLAGACNAHTKGRSRAPTLDNGLRRRSHSERRAAWDRNRLARCLQEAAVLTTGVSDGHIFC